MTKMSAEMRNWIRRCSAGSLEVSTRHKHRSLIRWWSVTCSRRWPYTAIIKIYLTLKLSQISKNRSHLHYYTIKMNLSVMSQNVFREVNVFLFRKAELLPFTIRTLTRRNIQTARKFNRKSPTVLLFADAETVTELKPFTTLTSFRSWPL